MKEIESFTATALVLNSERLIHWSTIDGLTIDGLTRADAVAVMRLVESVSERAREQADAAPATPASASAATPAPSSVSDAPATALESPPARDTPRTAATPEKPTEKPQAPKNSAKRAAQKRVPRREVEATPAAPDLAPPWATPKEGDTIDEQKVHAVKPTVEGGAVVTLGDGTRIKFDGKGNEVTRVVPEVKTQPPTDEAPTPPSTITPPEEVMQTRMTRDVLKWVMDQGVTERDQIIAECERLKTAGAVAFSTCPDVRQRASTVLTAMGVA